MKNRSAAHSRIAPLVLGAIALLTMPSGQASAQTFPAGYLYLATSDGIIELDEQGSSVRTIDVGGQVNGVAFGPNGNLYATVFDQDEVVEVSPDGTVVMTISSVTSQPFGLAVGRGGCLLVTTWLNDNVQVFASDGGSLTPFGAGTMNGGAGLTFGPAGHVFACSSTANRIVELGADGSDLGTLTSGTVLGPRDVVVTSYGTLLIGTWDSNALFQTDMAGTVLNSDTSTSAPQAIAMGPDGLLYVGDVQVVNRFAVTEDGFASVDGFATPTISVGSIHDMAFSPQRVKVEVVGKLVTSDGDTTKIDEKATLSISPDGYQVMLHPSEFGELVNHMESFVGYGPERHGTKGHKKRRFHANSVSGDSASGGVSTITLDGKGFVDLDDRFFVEKVSGSFSSFTVDQSFWGTVKGKKTLN